jgi:uncharacterized protein involved in exopolysaccharide biosynthesis
VEGDQNLEQQSQPTYKDGITFSYTLRDLASVGFRHYRVIILSFFGITLGAISFALMQPLQYEAKVKIILNRERVDPIVSPEDNAAPRSSGASVTEQEQNSEVELIKSRDLLQKVVVAAGLNRPKTDDSWWAHLFSTESTRASDDQGSAPDKVSSTLRAADVLLQSLQVQPITKSNIITVTYKDSDPQQATRVLNTFADLYLVKHLEVHRPAGTLEFFQQETERYRKGLATIEDQLSNFGHIEGVASAQLEKQNLLQRLSEFEAKLKDTKASVAETEGRIQSLEAQLASTPPRLVDVIRTSANSELIHKLKSELLTLELKRTELLGKYEPSYRAVQELEKQISQTRATLAVEEKVLLREESTDRNPTYERLKQDLAQAKSDLPGLQAREAKMTQEFVAYREKARQLYQKEIAQNDLLRAQKMAEETYQLYTRKQEEARISDALDKQRILNVAIADRATVPLQPSGLSRSLIVLIGGILAGMMSAGLAFALDLMDQSFRTPDELRAFLNVPVLAAIPKNGK